MSELEAAQQVVDVAKKEPLLVMFFAPMGNVGLALWVAPKTITMKNRSGDSS